MKTTSKPSPRTLPVDRLAPTVLATLRVDLAQERPPYVKRFQPQPGLGSIGSIAAALFQHRNCPDHAALGHGTHGIDPVVFLWADVGWWRTGGGRAVELRHGYDALRRLDVDDRYGVVVTVHPVGGGRVRLRDYLRKVVAS